jgi:hypothetical protein
VADSYITWDEDQLEQLLNTPEGPVGQMLEDLAARATLVAKAAAPVQKPSSFSWGRKRSTSYMPWSGGYTKSRIVPHMGYTRGGTLFSGVNAPLRPTLFLERPARQMRRSYPFMTTALDSINL